MTVDSGSLGLFQALVPVAGTNLCTNPSAEVNTTGWTGITSTFTRIAGGVFGAWCFQTLATAQYGRGQFTTATLTNGQQVTISAWVKYTGASNVLYLHGFGSVTPGGIQFHPGDGLWHRLECTFSMTATEALFVAVEDSRASAWTAVQYDGVQIETGTAASTYIDGDQDGCSWTAGAHASTSTRDARDGRGGTISTLDVSNAVLTDVDGIGLPTFDVATQALAIADGEVYQQSTAKARALTLIYALYGTSAPTGLHTVRRSLLALVNPDSRSGRGPVTLRYTGSAVTKRLRSYYAQGFEWESTKNGTTQTLPLRFIAPDPMFEAETDESAALATCIVTTPTGTTGGILQRNPTTGAWSTMNGGFAGINAGSSVNVMRLGPDGTLYVAGDFTGPSTGGTTPKNFAYWTGSAWSSLGAIDPNGTVIALAISPGGSVAIAGAFTAVGAVANTNRIALWDGSAWTALSTGANGNIGGIAYDQNGFLWAAGAFTTIGGVAAAGTAYWNGSAWTALAASGGLTNLQLGPDGLMYANSATNVWVYGSAWSSIGAATGGSVLSIQWTPKGLYAMGSFTAIGGVTAAGAARWNGAVWEAIATTVTPTQSFISASVAPDGTLLTMGSYSGGLFIDGSYLPWDLAAFDGSTWSGYDVIVGANADGVTQLLAPNGTLTLSYATSSGASDTRVLPGLTTVTNSGTAPAYPVLRFGSGAGLIYSLVNLTTGRAIRFNNLTKYSGETVTLDLRPGRVRLTSSSGRELLRSVLGGSDLDTFTLAPGVNIIQAFTASTLTTADLFWRPRFISAD